MACPTVLWLQHPEVWRPTRVAGYSVSSWGRVRRDRTGSVLRPQMTTKGYTKVHLGRAVQEQVHVLVAEAFHGPRPLGCEVDHLDHVRTTNAALNLRWLRAYANAVRWAGRHPDGRIIWAHRDEPDPYDADTDYPPLTTAELHQLADAWNA